MPALVEQADEDEQRTGRDAMIQHLVNRAIETQLREAEDAENDEAQVAHRRIRHQLLHIGLHHGHERAIDDADNRQHDDPGGARARRLRKHRQAIAHQAVRSHFQHDGREHDGAGGGRLNVRVG